MSNKIAVTGASGLLGSAILHASSEVVGLDRNFDLLKGKNEFFCWLCQNSEVTTVIHCAAKVGGIKANTAFVADFFEENVKMNMEVFDACHRTRKKLVSLLSTCVYPDSAFVAYPLTENQLHLGPPHYSNFGYAYAKRMAEVQSRAYRQQFGDNFITVIPNNLYGLNDNYDLDSGHVVPALIRKFHEAKLNDEKRVVIWGSGKPLREFTFAEDAARIILWLSENYEGSEPVNIGNPEQVSIKELATTIAEISNFRGDLVFDTTMPDGQYQKPSSNSKLLNLGWSKNYTPLKEGLISTISHFQNVYPNVRGVTM